MKMTTTKKALAAFLIAFGTSSSLFAQETFTLNPKLVEPTPQGYFIAGRVVNDVLHNGCGVNNIGTEHAASSHNESGTSAGFSFNNVSIMTPDCLGKGTPEAGFPSGYLQLREFANFTTYGTNPNDASLVYGNIVTPQVTNLRSLEVKAGSDVSINNSRTVVFGIERSIDNGQTWAFVTTQALIDQGGRTYLFEAGSSPGFDEVIALSNTQPVRLRILPWIGATTQDVAGNRGQRLKVHQVTLVGTAAAPTSVKAEVDNSRPFYQVSDKAFVATKGNLHVYSLTGALVGTGKSVSIPRGGLYIVRSDEGLAKKVFVQQF